MPVCSWSNSFYDVHTYTENTFKDSDFTLNRRVAAVETARFSLTPFRIEERLRKAVAGWTKKKANTLVNVAELWSNQPTAVQVQNVPVLQGVSVNLMMAEVPCRLVLFGSFDWFYLLSPCSGFYVFSFSQVVRNDFILGTTLTLSPPSVDVMDNVILPGVID